MGLQLLLVLTICYVFKYFYFKDVLQHHVLQGIYDHELITMLCSPVHFPEQSFLHSLNNDLLQTHHVSSTFLDTGGSAIKKKKKVSFSWKFDCSGDNKQT